MYKIIGADGKEYGPVTLEQLRQWIAQGRANAQTKVQVAGSTGWKTLSELPEFSASLSGAGAAGAIAPTSPGNTGGSAVDIARCISRSWKLLTNNFWRLVGTTFLVFLILGGMGILLRVIVNIAFGVPLYVPGVSGFGVIRLQWRGILAAFLWNLFMAGALLGGLYNYYLKLIRGQPASLADAFAGFSSAFVPLTMAHVVSAVLTTVGCVLCLLPGVYLSVAWRFALPLVIDKNLGFWDAMETSRKAVTRQWWSLFALLLLAGLIGASGLIACCIGVLGTAPIGIAVILYAYEDIFGGPSTQSSTTAEAV